MKKFISIFLVACLMLPVTMSALSQSVGDSVTLAFDSETFYDKMLTALEPHSVTSDDSLKTITIKNSSISSVTSLDLSGIAHTTEDDLANLSKFTSLTSLNLQGTEVSDLSFLNALADITTLSTLNIIDTGITDMSALSAFSGVTTVSIGSQNVTVYTNKRDNIVLPAILVQALDDTNTKTYAGVSSLTVTGANVSADNKTATLEDSVNEATISVGGTVGTGLAGSTVKIVYDTTAPTATVKYSTSEATTGTVTATITSNEMMQAVSGWKLSADKLSMSKEYSENTKETITLLDIAGNKSSASVDVNNIDKTSPTLTVSLSTSEKTNQSVTVTVKSTKQIKEVSGWTLSADKMSISKVFDSNSNETVTVYDMLGNTSSIGVSVTNIDKDVSPLKISKSPSGNTIGSVTYTISSDEKLKAIEGWTLSADGKSLSKVFDTNTNTTLTVYDELGNSKSVTVSITNIIEEEVNATPVPTAKPSTNTGESTNNNNSNNNSNNSSSSSSDDEESSESLDDEESSDLEEEASSEPEEDEVSEESSEESEANSEDPEGNGSANPEDPESSNGSANQEEGGAPFLVIVSIVGLVLAIGGGVFLFIKKRNQNIEE